METSIVQDTKTRDRDRTGNLISASPCKREGGRRKPLTILTAPLDGATAHPATKAQVPSSACPSSYFQGPRPVHSASQTVLKATHLHPHGHTGLSCLRDHSNSRGHPSSHSCLSLIHPPHWPGSDHFHWRINCKHLNRASQPRQPKPSPLANLASVLQQCPPCPHSHEEHVPLVSTALCPLFLILGTPSDPLCSCRPLLQDALLPPRRERRPARRAFPPPSPPHVVPACLRQAFLGAARGQGGG